MDLNIKDTTIAKRTKVYAVRDFLSSLHVDTTIVFNDASDVVYLQSKTATISKLREWSGAIRSGTIFFGAERNFWPYFLDGKVRLPGAERKFSEYPVDNTTSFRFLNSGQWIGRRSSALQLCKYWTELLETTFPDDQQAAHEVFLSTASNTSCSFQIKLDTNCRIFQTGHATNLESERLWFRKDDNGPYVDQYFGQVLNTETNSEPVFLHFNGGKATFPSVADFFWNISAQEQFQRNWNDYIKLYPSVQSCEKFFVTQDGNTFF